MHAATCHASAMALGVDIGVLLREPMASDAHGLQRPSLPGRELLRAGDMIVLVLAGRRGNHPPALPTGPWRRHDRGQDPTGRLPGDAVLDHLMPPEIGPAALRDAMRHGLNLELPVHAHRLPAEGARTGHRTEDSASARTCARVIAVAPRADFACLS